MEKLVNDFSGVFRVKRFDAEINEAGFGAVAMFENHFAVVPVKSEDGSVFGNGDLHHLRVGIRGVIFPDGKHIIALICGAFPKRQLGNFRWRAISSGSGGFQRVKQPVLHAFKYVSEHGLQNFFRQAGG